AEDGIRDWSVTGVQTCALPIFESEVSQEIADALQANLSPSESQALASVGTHDAEAYDLFLRGEYELHQAESSVALEAYDRADARSEERRVGKECRCGWSQDHEE